MTRNYKRPKFVRASSLKRAARKAMRGRAERFSEGVQAMVDTAVEATIAERAEKAADAAPTTHEAYAAYVAAGNTQAATAKHFGVSRQVVHQAVHRAAYLAQRRTADNRRYAEEVGHVRPTSCTGCGGIGHHIDSPDCPRRG